MPQEPQSQTLTIPEFAARIKAKHPEYGEVEDTELTRRLLEKYPQYRSKVNLGTEAEALTGLNSALTRQQKAAQALQQGSMSATGRQLNPTVTAGTDYFRPLTAEEQAAQQRGEPVVISQAQPQTPAVAPQMPATPPAPTTAPVNLSPVIQNRVGQIEQQQRQQALQQKVAQARKVMSRGPSILLPPGHRNKGAAFQPTFGQGQPYKEALANQIAPMPTKTIPTAADLVQAANSPAAKQKAKIKAEATRQIDAEDAAGGDFLSARRPASREERIAARASDLEANVADEVQRVAEYQKNKPTIDRLAAQYSTILKNANPRLGQGSSWTNEVIAKAAPELMNKLAAFGRIAGAGGSPGAEYAAEQINLHAQALQQAAMEAGASRNEASQFVQDITAGFVGSSPELAAMMAGIPAPIAFGAGSGLSALGAKQPVVPATVKGIATGAAYEIPIGGKGLSHIARKATAVGIGTGAVELASGATPEQAAKTGLTNALISVAPALKDLTKVPKAVADYTLKSPITPEPVKDVVANAMQYGKGLIRSTDGRNMSLYADPNTGEVFASEITGEQAKKYDPTIVTGEKRSVRNAKEVSPEDYDMLAATLGAETKAGKKQLAGEVPKVEPRVEKEVKVPTSVVTTEKPNVSEPIVEKPEQIQRSQTQAVTTPKGESEKSATPVSVSPAAPLSKEQTPAEVPPVEAAPEPTPVEKKTASLPEPVKPVEQGVEAPKTITVGEGNSVEVQKVYDEAGTVWPRVVAYDLNVEGKPSQRVMLGIKGDTAEVFVGRPRGDFMVETDEGTYRTPRDVVGTATVRAVRKFLQQEHPEIKQLTFARGGSTGGRYGREVRVRLQDANIRDSISKTYDKTGARSRIVVYELERGGEKLRVRLLLTDGGKRAKVDIGEPNTNRPELPDQVDTTKRRSFGTRAMLELKRYLQEQHPEVETIDFKREGSTGGNFGREVELSRPTAATVTPPESEPAAEMPTTKGGATLEKATEVAKPKTATLAGEGVTKGAPSTTQRLTDWSSRLKTIAQAKDLKALQSLSDEMAAHKDDPRVARLRTSVQAALAQARQPKIPEKPVEAPKVPTEQPKPTSAARPSAKQRITQTRQEYVGERMRNLPKGNDPIIAQRNAIQEHDYAVKAAVRKGTFLETVGDKTQALAVLESLGKRVPNYIKREIASLKGTAYEMPDARLRRPVGRPKSDPEQNSLETEIRARGGVKDDGSGEVRQLKESGKQGLVTPNGMSAERMARSLAEDGYGRDVWWEPDQSGSGMAQADFGVHSDSFLQAAIDDASGSTKHYSTMYDPDLANPDEAAFNSLMQDGYGRELIELVESGRARANDILELAQQAKEFGISDEALRAFLNSVSETVKEELPEGTREGEGYTLDQDGTLIDPDGTPLFAREFQLGLPDEGLLMQESAPKTTDQREALIQAQRDREEAANPERAAAMRKLEEIHRRGMSVDEYARQGSMFEAAPSAAEIKLLKELEKPSKQTAEEEQTALFAKGKTSTEPLQVSVKGNQVAINPAGARLLSDAYRELGHLAKKDRDVRGAFQRQAERLAAALDEMKSTEATELAKAVREAVKNNPKGRVVLYSGEGVKRHELFHEASAESEKTLRNRHADFDSLTEDDTFSRIYRQLVKLGYAPYDMPALVEEAAAHIAEGKYLQLGITREEAVDWMTKWFKSFEKANPHVNPRQFQEMSDEAEKARNQVYQSYGLEPLADETVPSLQEGGEGGNREDLAAARGGITDTEAFRRWFGDSKVVDKKGQPLVVYHGTDVWEDFNQFDPTRAISSLGVHFGTSPTQAERVPEAKGDIVQTGRGGPQRMIPAYLRIENPLRLKDEGTWYSFDLADRLGKAGLAPFWNKPETSYKWGEERRHSQARKLYDGYVQNGINDFTKTNPQANYNEVADHRIKLGNEYIWKTLQHNGYDGIVYANEFEAPGDSFIVGDAHQIKSATGNRGTFDPNNPNILMARSDDPWEALNDLADEFERLAKEPELPEGQKPLSLPKTLEAAGLEAGPTRGYEPESIVDDGLARAKQTIADKGIDGAMEFVRSGDGIHWASTGFEVSGRLRAEEANLRNEGKTEEADAIRDKRMKFLDDFALAAAERGRSIVGIKAVAEFAPDRLAYELNKLSLKKRKKGISPETEKLIADIGEQLGDIQQRYDALQTRFEELQAKAGTRVRAQQKPGKPKKTDYQSKLDEQASVVLQTLKPKVGNLDLSGLQRKPERGAVKIGIPPLPGDAELVAQYAAAKLSAFDKVVALNDHLVETFGDEISQFLPAIRQRAYAIRQEVRLAEIEAKGTQPERRRTILGEIQAEIADNLRAIQESKKAEAAAQRAERAAEAKSERLQARLARQEAQKAEAEERRQMVREARERLKQVRQEYKEAAKRETEGWREVNKARKEAERKAALWDTPLRNEAAAAAERLKDATSANDPQTHADLVAVATAHFLPDTEGGTPRAKAVDPSSIYVELKKQFPNLVNRKNQGKIYAEAYEHYHDMTRAAKEAARLRSANEESKRLWDELGMDIDAQGVLIQQAELRRKQFELRNKATAEFERVRRSKLGKFFFEVQAFPRSARSSIDAPLGRQGLYELMVHPLLTLRHSVPAGARGYAAIREADYLELQHEISEHPRYSLGTKAGLDITEMASRADAAIHAEEAHQSALAEKLPHVRVSEQAYIAEMNVIRLEVFNVMASQLEADGKTFQTNPEAFEQAAKLVNVATGRGNMPDFMKKASSWSNFMFWSTRLGVSRFQLMNNLFNPFKYLPAQGPDTKWYNSNPMDQVPGFASYDPTLRKYQLGQIARLAAALGILYLLARAAGFDISSFPVIRVGNTRYDLSNGEVNNARFLMKIYQALHAAQKGEESKDLFMEAAHYGRGKLAPVPGAVVDTYYGKDFAGQPVNTWPFVRHPVELFESAPTGKLANQNILLKQILPMVTYDFSDAIADSGWLAGTAKALPALTGVSTGTYADKGLKAIKNKALAAELERIGITNQSLTGQKTKDEVLDAAIESRVLAQVEKLEVPQGSTDVGKEKIIKERLEQIRALAKAEAGAANPEHYRDYLKNQTDGVSMSFLTDEEKKTLTEADLKKYRSNYADAYIKMLTTVASKPEYQQLTDDQKEKMLTRLGRIAHIQARRATVEEKRPQK